jgi:hypothetical protein
MTLRRSNDFPQRKKFEYKQIINIFFPHIFVSILNQRV